MAFNSSVLLVLVITLKCSVNLKYVAVCSVIFIPPSLTFYKYETENIAEFRPKKGILYDFNVNDRQIKLYTCLGNKDSVEIVPFSLEAKDSTYFRTHNPGFFVNNKTFILNNNSQLSITDENCGVGLYYLKLTKWSEVE